MKNKSFLRIRMHTGLLILRLGIGTMFIIHGIPKIFGGAVKWEKLGDAAAKVGLDFLPHFWGFMGAFSEFFGGFLIAVGLFFRPACALLIFTMIVASNLHFSNGDAFSKASHAIESGILFMALFLMGPGKYSVDYKLFHSKHPFS